MTKNLQNDESDQRPNVPHGKNDQINKNLKNEENLQDDENDQRPNVPLQILQSVNLSIFQSSNLSIFQSFNLSIFQSFNLSIFQRLKWSDIVSSQQQFNLWRR